MISSSQQHVSSLDRYKYRIKLGLNTKAPIGVGSFAPGSVLLIGEQASDPTTAPEQQPFCSTKGCSGWLNLKLQEAEVPEEKLFWINALNNDGSEVDLQLLVQQLQPSAVIALGGIAQRVCREQGVEFEAQYHPQYWKRFKSKHRYPLLDRLKELT